MSEIPQKLCTLADKYEVTLARDAELADPNQGSHAGTDIWLGEFDDPDLEVVAFFHEVGHALSRKKRFYPLECGMCELSMEAVAWELGFSLAHDEGYRWSYDSKQMEYARKCFFSYLLNSDATKLDVEQYTTPAQAERELVAARATLESCNRARRAAEGECGELRELRDSAIEDIEVRWHEQTRAKLAATERTLEAVDDLLDEQGAHQMGTDAIEINLTARNVINGTTDVRAILDTTPAPERTTEPPTEPGWYWWLRNPADGYSAVKLDECGRFRIGGVGPWYDPATSHGEWHPHPITPPTKGDEGRDHQGLLRQNAKDCTRGTGATEW